MSVRDKYRLDKVFLFRACRNPTFSSTSLRLVIRDRLRLRVAFMGERNHHILWCDQVLVFKVFVAFNDFGATPVPVLIPNRYQLIPDHFHQSVRIPKNKKMASNSVEHLQVFVPDLLLFEAGQPVQSKIQNRLSLGG